MFATVAWVVSSLGFRLYLETATSGSQVFGVLGGALTVLVWLHLLGIGLLLGGELNAVLNARHRADDPHGERRGGRPGGG